MNAKLSRTESLEMQYICFQGNWAWKPNIKEEVFIGVARDLDITFFNISLVHLNKQESLRCMIVESFKTKRRE